MLIDTHAHIYLEEFDDDREQMMDRALDAGVFQILLPNIDESSIEPMLQTVRDYPDVCYPMMGLHPCSVKEDYGRQLDLVGEWLGERDFIAVGEIGTDLYWDKTYWKEQQDAFQVQCRMSIDYGLPIVVHCRESIDETIGLVKPFVDQGLNGVFHCFTGTVEQANQLTEMGFLLGIGGVATFKNGGLREILPEIGLQNIVLETDSPYLAPVPYRGKRNEPAYLHGIREIVAQALNKPVEEVESVTTANAKSIFGLK